MKIEVGKFYRSRPAKSTKVNAWSAHWGELADHHSATVRGPFMRWFRVLDVPAEYRHHVAAPIDDATFAAAAMNAAPALIAELRLARAARAQERSKFQLTENERIEWVRRGERAETLLFEEIERSAVLEEALEKIAKKEPMKVGRNEAADMACEFSIVARETLTRRRESR